MLNYPLTYNSMHFNGPTMIYLDEDGTPVQVQLNNHQVQSIVNDFNSAPDDGPEDEAPTVLKPPLGM